mgnify:FL=1|jgi:hypothetical protein
MRLLLERIALRDTYTIGKLYVDGQYFCDTLEDRVRDLSTERKVPGETAIPPGTYDVVVNISPKFKRLLPRLLRVPHFDGILIHAGNRPEDSAGCILVGENRVRGTVSNSRYWEKRVTELLLEAQGNGDDIKITVR